MHISSKGQDLEHSDILNILKSSFHSVDLMPVLFETGSAPPPLLIGVAVNSVPEVDLYRTNNYRQNRVLRETLIQPSRVGKDRTPSRDPTEFAAYVGNPDTGRLTRRAQRRVRSRTADLPFNRDCAFFFLNSAHRFFVAAMIASDPRHLSFVSRGFGLFRLRLLQIPPNASAVPLQSASALPH